MRKAATSERGPSARKHEKSTELACAGRYAAHRLLSSECVVLRETGWVTEPRAVATERMRRTAASAASRVWRRHVFRAAGLSLVDGRPDAGLGLAVSTDSRLEQGVYTFGWAGGSQLDESKRTSQRIGGDQPSQAPMRRQACASRERMQVR